MTYPVEFYADGKLLATGTADDTNKIVDVVPTEGRGLAHGRILSITVKEGRHAGQTILARIAGETDHCVSLHEPMPFR